MPYLPDFPTTEHLRRRARSRIPGFAFDYLEGGCNEEVNLLKNTTELREVELKPFYLSGNGQSEMRTQLFGHTYDAPFGIAPIGLQGLMWPGAPEILARAAVTHNIPFVLSTVTTASIERIGEITGGRFWYQLYNPGDTAVRDDLLRRAAAAGCQVLVLLCDVPSFGFRPREIRVGLSMPPRMSWRNIMQILSHPHWAWRTLLHGKPAFETMKKYGANQLNMKRLGERMNTAFSRWLDEERISAIRERWPGTLVLKGVASTADADLAVRLGLDGIIVSNHGGRQLDAGQSSIRALSPIVEQYGKRIKVMLDSGLRSGPDVARALASGAEFTFLGRTFMYGVAALGAAGGEHTISMLKAQLQQVMEQLCCARVADLPRHLVHQA